MSTATAHPFDRLASRYDEIWTRTVAGRLEREAVWQILDPLFAPGQRLLDVGCGTGVDSLHLAQRGIHVHAIDASAEMVRITRSRLQGQRIDVTAAARQMPLECLPMKENFDGALLNFGVLNCVKDLPGAARSLAAALRPGAPLLLCFMGRFYLWESLRFGLRLQPAKAIRRWRRGAVIASLDGSRLPVYYRSFAEIRAAFEPHFSLVSRQGIGVFVPFCGIIPRAARLLARLDHAIATWPGLRAIGDHQLAVFLRNQIP